LLWAKLVGERGCEGWRKSHPFKGKGQWFSTIRRGKRGC